MLNGQLVIIELEELQILGPWLFCVLLVDSFLLTFGFNTDFLRIWLTDFKIFFGSVSREVRRHRLVLFLLWGRRLNEDLHAAFLRRSLTWTDFATVFADAFALRLFLLLLARTWWLLTFWRFRFIVGDVLLCSVSVVKLLFFTKCEPFPFLDDFGHKLGLPHSWELVSILVVFLSWKLSVEFCQLFLLEFALH